MPADPIHPDQLHGEHRFRADVVAYLDSLPVGELVELLGELARSRQQPLGLGVLIIALNERLPDAYKLLPAAGHPGPHQPPRRPAIAGPQPEARPRPGPDCTWPACPWTTWGRTGPWSTPCSAAPT